MISIYYESSYSIIQLCPSLCATVYSFFLGLRQLVYLSQSKKKGVKKWRTGFDIAELYCSIDSRELPLVTKHTLTQIFIKCVPDIVLEISILDINSQNWIDWSCLNSGK